MDNDFYLLLELVDHPKTEETPLKLGNVEFWQSHDEWCYSIPKSQWDVKAITSDLNNLLMGQLK